MYAYLLYYEIISETRKMNTKILPNKKRSIKTKRLKLILRKSLSIDNWYFF